MLVQAVDLAAVAWATCLSDGGQPHVPVDQTCAWYHNTEFKAVTEICRPFEKRVYELGLPDVMVVEDQPHGVRFDTYAKNTARMQGRIIDRMDHLGYKDRVLFVPPALWQRTFDGVWRGKEAGAAAAAERYGYTPPNLLELHKDQYEHLRGAETSKERSAIRSKLKKMMSDYIDAFLIAVWAHETLEKHGTLDVKSTQRYLR